MSFQAAKRRLHQLSVEAFGPHEEDVGSPHALLIARLTALEKYQVLLEALSNAARTWGDAASTQSAALTSFSILAMRAASAGPAPLAADSPSRVQAALADTGVGDVTTRVAIEVCTPLLREVGAIDAVLSSLNEVSMLRLDAHSRARTVAAMRSANANQEKLLAKEAKSNATQVRRGGLLRGSACLIAPSLVPLTLLPSPPHCFA
jgi:hypothetical protein